MNHDVTYNGILHNFTFEMQGQLPAVRAYEKSTSNPLLNLKLSLPDFTTSKKTLPPME